MKKHTLPLAAFIFSLFTSGILMAQQGGNGSLSRSSSLGLQWEELGPENKGGRTRAILIDKRDTTNNTYYAGSVAGGLWKSTDGANTWVHLPGVDDWMAIACITQGPAPDYTIYFGTGVGLDGVGEEGTSFASAQYGNGVFKLSPGDSAVLLTPTVMPGSTYNPNSGSPWFAVNRVAVNPADAGQIIAATLVGLYQSNDTGTTWTRIVFTGSLSSHTNEMFVDVKWSVDGNNVYAVYSNGGSVAGMLYSNNASTSWAAESASNTNFPATTGRIELAVTPANPQMVCILASTEPYGCTKGLYKSSDAGHSWSVIATGGPLFQLFEADSGTNSCQGNYDMAIAVSPTDTDKIYVGGVNFYTASVASGLQPVVPFYQLRDYHAIVIADNNPNIMVLGGDEGVYKSTNAFSAFPNITFDSVNTGYNSVLNYGIAAGIDGSVIAGAQNGGTNYISFPGNGPGVLKQVTPYDGFLSAVSQVNPDFYFASIYYAGLLRSPDHATTFGNYFDAKVDPYGQGGATVCGGNGNYADAQFCTPYYLGETFNAVGGTKQVLYTATDRTHYSGETVPVTSATGGYQFNIRLADSVTLGSSILVSDPIRSRIFMSTTCGIFLTSQALSYPDTPQWYELTDASLYGNAQSFALSADGNNLYVATNSGYVYRFHNLNIHADTCVYPASAALGILYRNISDSNVTKTVVAPSRSIEGMDVDPNDNNHLMVVVSGFSASNQPHVYESHDGGQSWVADTAGLPNIPCYSIVMHSATSFIMGTEFGIWTWDGSSWHEDNANLGRAPVYRITERNLRTGGCPVLYIGTHGRGMWRSTTLTPAGCNTVIETAVKNVKPNEVVGLNVFPNPTNGPAKVSISLSSSSSITIKVYDLVGKLYSERAYQNVSAGTSVFDLDVSGMSNGMYVVAATFGDKRTISKLLVVTK